MATHPSDPQQLLKAAEKEITHLRRCARAYSIAYKQLADTQKSQDADMARMQATIKEQERLLAQSDAHVQEAVAALGGLRSRMDSFRENSRNALESVKRSVSTDDIAKSLESLMSSVEVDQEVEFIDTVKNKFTTLRD